MTGLSGYCGLLPGTEPLFIMPYIAQSLTMFLTPPSISLFSRKAILGAASN